MRKLMTVLIALTLVGLQVPAALGQDATPDPGDQAALIEQVRNGEVCAWPVEVSMDALNIAYPDKFAAYFVMPYMLGADRSLILEGTYPEARFMSLTTYYGVGVPGQAVEVLGWMRDTHIVPDEGSANPVVDPNAPDDPAQRRWTARVSGTAPVDPDNPSDAIMGGEGNVLVAHPEGAEDQLGLLVVRVYVPDDVSDSTGGVGLPKLTLEDETGAQRELPACSADEEATWSGLIGQLVRQAVASAPALPMPPSADAQPDWVESPVPGLGPNPDNRYLMAPAVWEAGRIVVIRGQAPTFPDTAAGDSAADPTDLRYWSFCTGANDVTEGYATADCVPDYAVPLDADGFYTVVVSQPEDRPANATAENGVAWLQGADPSQPELLVLRHMLPSDDYFDQSVWAVPELTPGVAAEVMGPYFPQTTYCDVATFEEGGADACFAAGDAATPAG